MTYTIRTVGPIAPADAIPPVISLDEAKAHLRVDFDTDDALIEAYVLAAQDHVERFTSHVLTPRVMEMALSAFPCGSWRSVSPPLAIEIPRAPVTGIVSIAYSDASDGSEVSLVEADWRWNESYPGLVLPAFNTAWPTAAAEAGAVRLRFEAGYDEGLAPASLVAAVKLMAGHLYANREAVNVGGGVNEFPLGVEALCRPYRRVSI